MNPLDELSLSSLQFLLERTDFSEPFLGFGFATQFKKEIQLAYDRKMTKYNDHWTKILEKLNEDSSSN